MNKKQKKSNGVPERDSKGRLFVNLMEDSGFKAVFADKDNKKLLVSMLNHLLPDYVRVKDIKHYRDRKGPRPTLNPRACALPVTLASATSTAPGTRKTPRNGFPSSRFRWNDNQSMTASDIQ